MDPKTRLTLRLLSALLSVAMAGSAVLLSLYGASIGLSRDAGRLLWAGTMLVLIVLLLGPLLARAIGARNAAMFLLLLLAAGAGVYGYVAHVAVPDMLPTAGGRTG